MTQTRQTALILGPNGKFGRHCAQAFAARGWEVIAFDRARDSLDSAIAAADVVVMGWHPPSYEMWERDLLPMHRRFLAAAQGQDVTVILPGNVYNFGPDAPRGWGPETPHLAANRLGQLRIAQEELYRAADVQTIVLRMGDFLDDEPTETWFRRFVMAGAASKGRGSYPGDFDAPHAWAYLPDAARAAVMLAERRDRLARFEDVPFAGYTLTARELTRAAGEALGRDLKLRRMSWLPLRLARPFMPVLKGVFEMRYLWDLPHHLDGARLAELCPDFRPTPLATGLRVGMGVEEMAEPTFLPAPA